MAQIIRNLNTPSDIKQQVAALDSIPAADTNSSDYPDDRQNKPQLL